MSNRAISSPEHAASPELLSSPPGPLDQAERLGALLAFLIACAMVVATTLAAGPLWRDEIHTLNIAQRPLGTIFQWPYMDTCPLLTFVVFKLGNLLPWDEITDCRVTGLIIGLASVGAFVGTARSLKLRLPCIVAPLVLFQPFCARYLITVRTYGLSAFFAIAAVYAFWNYCEKGGRRYLAFSFLAAFGLVQSNYVNALYLMLIGGVLALWLARVLLKRRALAICGVTGLALATLLPYIPAMRADREWGSMIMSRVPATVTLNATTSFLAPGHPVLLWVLLLCLWGLALKAASTRPVGGLTVLGSALVLACPVVHHAFLIATGAPYSQWHLVVPAVLTALGAEIAIDQVVRSGAIWLRLARLIGGVTVFALILPLNFPGLIQRQTNMDAVADLIQKEAHPNDYILVVPYYLGNSFHYYYKGQVPWNTVPTLSDYSLQRYDLMWRKVLPVKSGAEIDPAVLKARAALRSGGRLWVVGELFQALPAGELEKVRVPDDATLQTRFALLTRFSGYQVSGLIAREGGEKFSYPILAGQSVNFLESPPVYLIQPKAK